jgi:putative endonuclease
MEYFVYIVSCKNSSLYTGITTDVERRLRQHNGELKGGSAYTRSHRPVALVYSEALASKVEALRREIMLKKLSHAQKLELILETQKKGT